MTRARGKNSGAGAIPMAPSPDLEEEGHGFGRATILLCLAAVVGFVAWAALTPVKETVTGDGVVLPEGFVQRIEHLEGGIVAAVLVEQGETVTLGQTLVRLQQAATITELRRMEARQESLIREIDRQLAYATGQPRLSDGALGAIARSQQAVAEIAEAHREAQLRLLRSEAELRIAEFRGLADRRRTLWAELEIVTARFRQYEEAHTRSGAISGAQRDDVKLQKIQLERAVTTLEADILSAELRARIAQEQEAEFLAATRKEALSRVAELEAQRAEVDEEIERLTAAIARSEIAAPVTGRVQTIGAVNAGQVLAPGSLVAEIVPSDAELFVEVQLPADRIGDVAVGMEASVKALTFDYLRHGDVRGEIDSISPISAADQDGVLRYRIKLRLNSRFVGDESQARFLKPGMTVIAEMRGGSKTVLDFLLRPLQVVRDKALTEI